LDRFGVVAKDKEPLGRTGALREVDPSVQLMSILVFVFNIASEAREQNDGG
jgi:hypothetical protein